MYAIEQNILHKQRSPIALSQGVYCLWTSFIGTVL